MPNDTKPWYLSKTLWLNGLTLLATVLAADEVRQIIDPVLLVKIQAGLNLVLRLLTTEGVTVRR